MSKLILVTGAGGFIGGQLVKYLEQQGRRIRAVDQKETKIEGLAAILNLTVSSPGS